MLVNYEPGLLGLALTILRISLGWTQKELAKAAGKGQSTVCEHEAGKPAMNKDLLNEYAAIMGAPPLRVELALFAAGILRLSFLQPGSPVDPTEEQLAGLEEAIAVFLPTLLGQLRGHLVALVRGAKARMDLDQAEALWNELEPLGKHARLARVRGEAKYHTWAMALRLCDESRRKAADCTDGALDLAELALEVVRPLRRAQRDDPFYLRLQALCIAIFANALRVKGDHDRAEVGFARAWTLWKAGSDEAGLLSEARLLDLEASLRREQRRFEEALKLHDDALNLARPEEQGSILLNESATLLYIGDYPGALAVLDQAAPRIDRARQPRLWWVLRYNQTMSLCRLGRAAEAEPLVDEVRQLAVQLRNGLDLLNTLFLAGLADAGLGRIDAAVASLEQVCRERDRLGHAFDYALAGLDLALLYREQARWPEIRRLAQRMVAIFRERRIHRETLAAVVLFQEAAENEAVTVELVRRLQSYLNQARLQPGERFVFNH